MTAIVKAAAAPALPLLPPWLAFLCAGGCFAVAGYQLCVVEQQERLARSMGVELPWITGAVIDAGAALPVALVLAGGTILAAPVARGSSARFRELRPVAAALAIGAVAVAGLSLWSFVLIFMTLSKALQR